MLIRRCCQCGEPSEKSYCPAHLKTKLERDATRKRLARARKRRVELQAAKDDRYVWEIYRAMGCCGQCGQPSEKFYCRIHLQARNQRERDKRKRMQRERERKQAA